MKTPILAINEVAESQNNKYITINDALRILEASENAIYDNASVGAGPVNLSETQAIQNKLFRVSGASANFNLVFPSTLDLGSINTKRIYAVVNNDPAYTATCKASTGTGTTVILRPGESALIGHSFEDMFIVGPKSIYDIAINMLGQPAVGALVVRIVAAHAFALPDNFLGSTGYAGVNPDLTAVFDVRKNGVSIGSVSISNTGVFTFLTTGSGFETFAAGDRLEIYAPNPQDASLADVAVTLLGIVS